MGKYLFHGSYTADGLRGVIKEGGTGRQKAIKALVESVGGRLESFHFAFGKDSFFIICDLPDNEAAAAISVTVAATGAANPSTIVLLTPEQVDVAVKRSPSYRAPGR